MNTGKREKSFESFLKKRSVKNFLFALSVFLCFPNSLFSEYYLCADLQPDKIERCLDQSWQTALNFALEKSFVFGRDFVFTYGPLGFLSTRVDIGIHGFYLFIFDLFVAANFAFIIWFAWKRFYNFGAIFLTLFLCFLSPFADASFKLLVIMLFWFCLDFQKSSATNFIVPFVISLLSFFIKLNTSFVAIFFFYFFLAGSFFIYKKLEFGKIIQAILLPVFLYLSCLILNVDLFGYVKTGLQLVNNYNDSMNYISASFVKYNLFVAVVSFFSLLGFAVLFWRDKKSVRAIVLLLTFSAALFVLFKQAMVRSDAFHLFPFLYFAPVLWIFCLLFLFDKSRVANLAVLLFSFVTLLAGSLPLRYELKAAEFNPLNRFGYFSEVVAGENDELKKQTYANFKLPDEILQTIGQKSVDVFPQNVNLIYFNKLNYDPRPVFQSYAVFSEKLIELNQQKYESENAPEFIIFSNEFTDNRYGFFNDQGAKIAMLENYSIVKKFEFQTNEYLLFEKTSAKKRVESANEKTGTINFYQNYEIEDLNKTYLAKVKIDYTLFGKLSRFLYQPLSLKMILDLDDGTSREYRAIVPILESGVMINPFVESDDEYEKFFRGETNALKKIKSFRIEPFYEGNFEKLNLLNYKEPIKIELQEFTIK